MAIGSKAHIFGGGIAQKALTVDQFFEYLETVEGPSDAKKQYAAVSWVFRCTQLRADALSSIPYSVFKGESENEYEWPIDLRGKLWAAEAFLCNFGAAYWLKEGTRRELQDLRVLNAGTMKVKTDPKKGIVGFSQFIQGGETKFKPEEIVYFRMWHPEDDLGPGVAPARVALEACGLAQNANQWASQFFKSGAIPAVILTTEGMPPETEIARIRSMWEKISKGVAKAWRTIVLRAGITPTVIGQPVKDLAMPQLMATVRRQIAVAFGMPQTMLEDAANYATAREHRMSFHLDTVHPQARQIETAINAQLMKPLGLRFEFNFEETEAWQQQQMALGEQVARLVEVGVLGLNDARRMIGLPEEQMSEAPPQPAPQVQEKPAEEEEAETEPTRAVAPERLIAKRASALRGWRKKARDWHTQNGRLAPYHSDYIPDWLGDGITEAMKAVGPIEAFRFLKQEGPSRAEIERRLQKKIQQVLNEELEDIADAIESGAAVDLSRMEKALETSIAPELAAITTEQILRSATEFGIDFDLAQINAAALDWAGTYTYDLIGGLVDTTRAVVQKAMSQYQATPGMLRGDLVKLLEPAFGKVRAGMIATTETTRAYAEATNEYQRLLEDAGLKAVRVWKTSADETVCPICRPLNGKPEETWADEFPDGPPAHVNCRCWTSLSYVGGD